MYLIVDGRQFPDLIAIIDDMINWLGGTIYDSGLLVDKRLANDRDIILEEVITTKILDMTLKPTQNDQNGMPGTAFFNVRGEHFSNGFDVRHGGISGLNDSVNGFIEFIGPGSHRWAIKKNGNLVSYPGWDE